MEGEELVWADIVDWQSPSLIRLEWTMCQDSQEPLDVEIRFESETDNSTRVTIEFDDGPVEEPTGGFDCDWSLILARYVRFMGGTPSLD